MEAGKATKKWKPGTNVDFTPVIPKFLQGRMQAAPKKRNPDESDDEDNRPTIEEIPEGKERPELEDEAPTIVADAEIMALLEKQELVLGEGQLEAKTSAKEESKGTTDDAVVEFGFKSRSKKTAPATAEILTEKDGKKFADTKSKKRLAETDAEENNPTKRVEKKKMLSFTDEEDI